MVGDVPITVDNLVVLGLVSLALALFVTERLPVDVTAITVLVLLVVLEPWTGVGPEAGISGFANPATITVLAMFILSEGVRRSGVTQLLGQRLIAYTGDSELRQLAATMGVAGPVAGVVNNTPVVAVMIPMVTDIAERTGTSPSKLLIPLSYAAMLGGMLTLVGTSPNLIASDLSARFVGQRYTMFEFTQLGVLVLGAGIAYMLTVGRHLVPARLEPEADLVRKFDLAEYLSEIRVAEDAPIVGLPVSAVSAELLEEEVEFDVVQVVRDDRVLAHGLHQRRVRPEDVLIVRADRDTLLAIGDVEGLAFAAEPVTEARFEGTDEDPLSLVEVTILPNSRLVGETLKTSRFRQRYGVSVLAVRRGGRQVARRLPGVRLQGGDTLLVHATDAAIEALATDRNFVVSREIEHHEYRRRKIPVVVAILAGVIGVAALGYVPIVVSALGGVVALVVTGCLRPGELYDAVEWNVIFLIAGIIPLGLALEASGTAALLSGAIVPLADYLPIVVFLFCFYMLTAIVTEVITNVASVVLMFPVAVDVAMRIGADPFTFGLLVTFAASSSLMTPVGYQTNLMVFNRGGYRFTDFLRVGVPLQLLLGIVTSLGLVLFWGV